MPTQLITAPAAEPIALTEAKAHLRVDSTDDNDLITLLITVARQAAEHELQRSLITQTWEIKFDFFPLVIDLPWGPIITIGGVSYYDLAGVEQTLASTAYTLDAVSSPARIVPAYGTIWPDTQDIINAVRVRYNAGYGTAGSSVPAAIRQWMLLQIGAMYENRQASGAVQTYALPWADRLLDRYRILTPA